MIKGQEEALLDQEVDKLIQKHFKNAIVETFDGSFLENFNDFVQNLTTPSLFNPTKVVVLRHPENLTQKQLSFLLDQVNSLTETALIVVAKKAVDKELLALAASQGNIIEPEVNNQKERQIWIKNNLKENNLKLSPEALALLEDHLGEDLFVLHPIIEVLSTRYEKGTVIDKDQLEPYLTDEGEIAPWSLISEIDKGNTQQALLILNRLLRLPNKHPLAVLSILITHYDRILKAHNLSIINLDEIRKALGLKHSFQARQIRDVAQKLSFKDSQRIAELLLKADLDLKGLTGLNPNSVLEILVARLCYIFRITSKKKARTQ